MGRRRIDRYPITIQEKKFISNLEKKNSLSIIYSSLPKNTDIQDIYIYRGFLPPSITLNKDNIKTFSDSIFTEFMKVYSLKKETDSLIISFSIDSLKTKDNIYYSIDTVFTYPVK